MENVLTRYNELLKEKEVLGNEKKEVLKKVKEQYKEEYIDFIEKNREKINVLIISNNVFHFEMLNEKVNKQTFSIIDRQVYISNYGLCTNEKYNIYNLETKEIVSLENGVYFFEDFINLKNEIQKALDNSVEKIINELELANKKTKQTIERFSKSLNVEKQSVYVVLNDDYFLDIFNNKQKALEYAKTMKGNILVQEYEKSVEWVKNVFESGNCVDIEYSDSEFIKNIYKCYDL